MAAPRQSKSRRLQPSVRRADTPSTDGRQGGLPRLVMLTETRLQGVARLRNSTRRRERTVSCRAKKNKNSASSVLHHMPSVAAGGPPRCPLAQKRTSQRGRYGTARQRSLAGQSSGLHDFYMRCPFPFERPTRRKTTSRRSRLARRSRLLSVQGLPSRRTGCTFCVGCSRRPRDRLRNLLGSTCLRESRLKWAVHFRNLVRRVASVALGRQDDQ